MIPLTPAPPEPAAEAVASTPRRWPVRILLAALGRVPAAVILAGLVGLLAWGSANDWTLPKFAALTGEAEPAAAEPWCEAHNVPEAICVECHPDLLPRPTYYGWCTESGVHECPQCHPDVAQVAKPPPATPADKQRAADALAFAPRPENVSKSTLHHRRIQFASAEAVDRAGIGVEPVGRGPVTEAVGGPGEVTFDPTRTARLSPRTAGTVARVFKELGDRVAAGEVVALIDAAEVGRAKTELLSAVNMARLKATVVKGLTAGGSPPRSVQEAEAQLAEARIRVTAAEQALANLGLHVTAADLADVPDDKLADRVRTLGLPLSTGAPGSANLWPLTAPVAGVVVARDVVVGEAVDPTKVLFVVSDLARVWVTLGLRAEDARGVKVGQPLRFRADGDRRELAAAVDYIAPQADHKTRTVKVRATVPDAPAWLKANTFGIGTVVLRQVPDAIVVPTEAVQPVPDGQVVFVRDRDYLASPYKLFHPRFVRTGAADGKQTEIIAGLVPGEVIVVQGAAALRAELLRGTLGEG